MPAQVAGQATDIFDRSALDCPPLVLIAGGKQRVIAEKTDQSQGRKLADSVGWSGPNGAAERSKVVPLEPIAGAQFLHEIAQCCHVVPGKCFGAGIESQYVANHAKETWPHQIPRLRHQGAQRLNRIFYAPLVQRGAK